MADDRAYYIGCPVWTSPGWKGTVYRSKSPRADWLKEYAEVFTTVEGNSTFYALPSIETAKKWASDTPDGFKFALKFPKIVSHELRLQNCDTEVRMFLAILDTLHQADRLGPTFLQLPPNFDSNEFHALERFLYRLPKEWPFAVEVRHPDYFDEGPVEAALDELLRSRQIDRVIFDSRPLFSRPPSSDSEQEAQRRKPNPPVRTTATGERPFLRLICRNSVEESLPWIKEWADQVADWIQQGRQPYVMTHSAEDTFAPLMAEQFHLELTKRLTELPPLPDWPGRIEQKRPRQPTLF